MFMRAVASGKRNETNISWIRYTIGDGENFGPKNPHVYALSLDLHLEVLQEPMFRDGNLKAVPVLFFRIPTLHCSAW